MQNVEHLARCLAIWLSTRADDGPALESPLIVARATKADPALVYQQSEQHPHGGIGPERATSQQLCGLFETACQQWQPQQQNDGGIEPLIEGAGGATKVVEGGIFATPALIHQLHQPPEQGALYASQGKSQQRASPLADQTQGAALRHRFGEPHGREFAGFPFEPGCRLQSRQRQGLLRGERAGGMGEFAQWTGFEHQQQEQQVEDRLAQGQIAQRPEPGGAGEPDYQHCQQAGLHLLAG